MTVAKPVGKRGNNGGRPPLAQRRKARRLILQAMYQWQMNKDDVAEIEAQFRAEYQGKYDWDYFHELFSVIPGQVTQLDELIAPHLDRSMTALDPVEKALLRIGTFELSQRVDIPYRVVINEAVELAKVFGATDGHKYVNGILDRLARDLRPAEAGRA
ncbi:MAG: transcription antitermination factor NusB [Pseudohongiellaceae bacterium]